MTAIAHTTDELDGTFLTWRIVADELAAELNRTVVYHTGLDAVGPAMEKYEYLKADDADSNMIAHARMELELAGWFKEDPDGLQTDWWAESLIAAVAEITHYGHSGGTIGFAVGMIEELIFFHPLSPITNNPDEWQNVTEYTDGTEMWQNRRDCRLFSHDEGQTWYSIEDPRWDRRFRGYFFRRKWNKQRNKALKPVPESEA